MKKRNVNLDLIRAVAIILVISVHFFKFNGFYNEKLVGINMFLMTYLRTFCMTCVPLFIMLSGYLMYKKELNKKYYLKLEKIIFVYVVASLLCILYKIVYLHESYRITTVIGLITSFKASRYAWYMNMYLGLFLIIPFLNVLYNNLNKKQKKVLLVTLFFVTILPQFINVKYKLLPNWWVNIYPFTYYFAGAYIKEYDIKINKKLNIILLILSIFIFGSIAIYFSYNKTFVNNIITGSWNSLQSFVPTILLFILLLNLNLEKIPNFFKKIILEISEKSFGMFLVSCIFDNFFYKYLNKYVANTPDKIYYFILMVLLIAMYSYILSTIINYLKRIFDKICDF